jgi:hypothetical protein
VQPGPGAEEHARQRCRLDEVVDDQREMVAGESCDTRLVAGDRTQAVCKKPQQFVAGLLPTEQVDVTQTLDGKQHECELAVAARRSAHELAQAGLQQRTVRQSRQRIVQRQIVGFRLLRQELERERQVPGDLAQQLGDGGLEKARLP